MRIGFVLFISLFVAADLLCWYISARSLRKQGAARAIRWTCHAFFAFQLAYILMMIGSILLGTPMRRGPEWLPKPLLALAFVWHIVGLPAVCFGILVTGTVRRTAQLIRWTRNRLAARPPEPPSVTPPAPTTDVITFSRRGFLAGAVGLVPPVLAMGATGYALATNGSFRINRLTVALPGLPDALNGFRIAHITDLHVGHWATDDFLHDVIRETNALDADAILFTGDLIDLSITDLPRALEMVHQWKARHGTFLIEGNHDLIDDPLGFRNRVLSSSGLRFLRSSSFTLNHDGAPLQILGTGWTRDAWAMHQDVQSLAARRDPHAFPILLAHHPHAFDSAAATGIPLTLAGHTHGGQLALLPGLSFGNFMFRYVSGIYQQNGSKLLVSNGTGNWFPLRINVPAEIIELTLRQA